MKTKFLIASIFIGSFFCSCKKCYQCQRVEECYVFSYVSLGGSINSSNQNCSTDYEKFADYLQAKKEDSSLYASNAIFAGSSLDKHITYPAESQRELCDENSFNKFMKGNLEEQGWTCRRK